MTPDQLVEYLLVPGMPKEAGAVTTTEREAKHMTERVTIDVDPDVVRVLRAVAGESATGVAWVHQRTLTTLADAIDAALPMPEPAICSIVSLEDNSVYARAGDGPYPWFGLRLACDNASWSYLRDRNPVVVFDGASLGAGQ